MSRPVPGTMHVADLSEDTLDALVRIQVRAGQTDAAVAMIADYVTAEATS